MRDARARRLVRDSRSRPTTTIRSGWRVWRRRTVDGGVRASWSVLRGDDGGVREPLPRGTLRGHGVRLARAAPTPPGRRRQRTGATPSWSITRSAPSRGARRSGTGSSARSASRPDGVSRRAPSGVDLDALFDPPRLQAPGPPRVAITFDDALSQRARARRSGAARAWVSRRVLRSDEWIGERERLGPPSAVPPRAHDGRGTRRTGEERGFAIESHGHAHVDYARAEPRAAEEDVRTSVAQLTELLGRPPRYLAYPYGRARSRRRRRGRAARAARRVHARPATAISGDFAVPRIAGRPGRHEAGLRAQDRRAVHRLAPQRARSRDVYGALRPLVRNRWLWP